MQEEINTLTAKLEKVSSAAVGRNEFWEEFKTDAKGELKAELKEEVKAEMSAQLQEVVSLLTTPAPANKQREEFFAGESEAEEEK